MNNYRFDDRTTPWQTLPGIEHLFYNILHIDEAAKIIDVLFKIFSQATDCVASAFGVEQHFCDPRRTSVV